MRCYPPWIGPDKCRVLVLLGLVVGALFVGLLYIPIATCSASDDGGLCAPVANPSSLPGLGTVGLPMWRGCTCNTSIVIRTSTNARTLSNTVFDNGDVPPTAEARGLSALTVSMLQFVLHDIAYPKANTLYDVPVPDPDPFFSTPANITVPQWAVATDGLGCPNPLSFTTPYIDLSNVYGVDPLQLQTQLRTGRHGQMTLNNAGLPILYTGAGPEFLVPAGDPRDTYTADLASLHTLLLRNHNSWADRVLSLHPDWTDDQLFWKVSLPITPSHTCMRTSSRR